MQGDQTVIQMLNQALAVELTAINQYFLHARIYDNCKRLAKYLYPGHTRVIMMDPLFNNTQRDHHEYEPIEKREQPPALV